MPKTFAYGTFLWLAMRAKKGIPPPPRFPTSPPGLPATMPGIPDQSYALEILREFGAMELVGKLYAQPSGGSWMPIQMDLLKTMPWFEVYGKNRESVVFDMQGSGAWEILHFRLESDDSGPYVAVAMRFLQKVPAWVHLVRPRAFRI